MSNNTGRIIKNTGFLYLRMLVIIFISLYTSRELLRVLGVEDFGLYHVVAGIVILSAFLQGSLSGATQRFIAFELGQSNQEQLKKTFSMSVNTHILFAFIFVLVLGPLGSHYLPALLTFDTDREIAVIVVFWCSLLSFAINIVVSPYHAMIIAHEEMKVFAWVSLIDAFLKLSIIYLLYLLPYDLLIVYGILVLLSTLSVALIYFIYVNKQYSEVRYNKIWDSTIFKRLISFSGWTIWGNAASVFSNQGTDVLLNVFFGPVVNAAKSVGNQASSALNHFVTNLQLAINPQIIKSYARNEHDYTNKLVNYGSKYNFFLLLTLALPIILRTDDALRIWLVEPPEHSTLFLRLILINLIIECISKPLITVAQATGKIKMYQFVVGAVLLLNIPLSYVFLSKGFPPAIVFVVAIGITVIAAAARIFMLKRIYDFSFSLFFKTTLTRIILVSSTALISSVSINEYIPARLDLLGFVFFYLVFSITTLVFILVLGVDKFEKALLIRFIKSKVSLRG